MILFASTVPVAVTGMIRSPRVALSCSPSNQALAMPMLAMLSVIIPPTRISTAAPIKMYFFFIDLIPKSTATARSVHDRACGKMVAPRVPRRQILRAIRSIFHIEHLGDGLVRHAAQVDFHALGQAGVLLGGLSITQVCQSQ